MKSHPPVNDKVQDHKLLCTVKTVSSFRNILISYSAEYLK